MKKLYLVTCQKFSFNFYVVAENETEAYEKVKNNLTDKDYGFSSDRQLNTIQLLAEEKEYPDTDNKIKKFYI